MHLLLDPWWLLEDLLVTAPWQDLLSPLAPSDTLSDGQVPAGSLTILDSEKPMASFTTSALWWTISTWGMKSGFCSRWPKVPGYTNCKCSGRGGCENASWGEIRDEKELADTFLFLPLLDELFHSMVVPYDLSRRSSRIFFWSSGQIGSTLYLLSILPYFISLFLLNLTALGVYFLIRP